MAAVVDCEECLPRRARAQVMQSVVAGARADKVKQLARHGGAAHWLALALLGNNPTLTTKRDSSQNQVSQECDSQRVKLIRGSNRPAIYLNSKLIPCLFVLLCKLSQFDQRLAEVFFCLCVCPKRKPRRGCMNVSSGRPAQA